MFQIAGVYRQPVILLLLMSCCRSADESSQTLIFTVTETGHTQSTGRKFSLDMKSESFIKSLEIVCVFCCCVISLLPVLQRHL